MKSPSIGRKPSPRHIVWKSGKDDQKKRFHESLLKKWCRKFAIDFENYIRVDHERSDEPRAQYQCVFILPAIITWRFSTPRGVEIFYEVIAGSISYQSGAGESFDMGDEEWTIQAAETPRTFVEIDEAGAMRIQGWSVERIVDVEELWYDGSQLVVKPDGEDRKLTIDATDLRP
jgi:hypothetical protein